MYMDTYVYGYICIWIHMYMDIQNYNNYVGHMWMADYILMVIMCIGSAVVNT